MLIGYNMKLSSSAFMLIINIIFRQHITASFEAYDELIAQQSKDC